MMLNIINIKLKFVLINGSVARHCLSSQPTSIPLGLGLTMFPPNSSSHQLLFISSSHVPLLCDSFQTYCTGFSPPTGTLVWNSEILEPLHMANVQSGQQQPKCESPIQQRSDEIFAARRMSNGITQILAQNTSLNKQGNMPSPEARGPIVACHEKSNKASASQERL